MYLNSFVVSGLLYAILTILASSVRAEVPKPPVAPEGGEGVLSSAWREQIMQRNGRGSVNGKPALSDDGIVLTTEKLAKSPYAVDVGIPIDKPVRRGQALLLRFAARSIKPADMTGQTQLQVYFQKMSPDWAKSVDQNVLLHEAWQRFDVPFVVPADFGAGEAGVCFGYGFAPQVAEIADVQLIAFPLGTDVKTLPQTKRSAEEVNQAQYDATVKRIAAFRKKLAGQIGVDADVVKTPGRVLHVLAAATGEGDGTDAKPFNTIQSAVNIVEPGDTILIGAGTYDQPTDGQSHTRLLKSGLADAWISIRAAPGARPKIVSPAWKAIELKTVSYIEIRGLELVGVNGEMNKELGNGVSIVDGSTHIRVIDNIVHGFGGGGVYSTNGDYIHVEGNTVYNTSKTSDWGNSAISLYQCINSDEAAGYKNVIRRNVCYDNENLKPFKFGGGSITDGNGVIIDDNRHTQNKSKFPAYTGWTLVENNLVYGNGGRGLHSYKSDRIDVINNTLYMNQWSKDIKNGELSASVSSEMNFFNNIVYARDKKRANSVDRAKQIIYARNLIFNTTDFVAGRDPIDGVDPLFVAAKKDAVEPTSFRLKSGSAAIGAGVKEVAPPDDLFGKPRGNSIDLGAIQGAAE